MCKSRDNDDVIELNIFFLFFVSRTYIELHMLHDIITVLSFCNEDTDCVSDLSRGRISPDAFVTGNCMSHISSGGGDGTACPGVQAITAQHSPLTTPHYKLVMAGGRA